MHSFKKKLIALSLVFLVGLSACKGNGPDEEKTVLSESTPTVNTEESAPTRAPLSTEPGEEEVTDAATINEITRYVRDTVNGPFRSYTAFPNFSAINEIPPIVFAGNRMLNRVTTNLGLEEISRTSYEAYLKENFNPEISLPLNANYELAYNKEKDSFSPAPEDTDRNFSPFSYFLDSVVTKTGDTYYFDTYEMQYEFVNAETGREETDNPIARMMIDGVTIGFSVPVGGQDLQLIDYRPLAKTRYTLEKNAYGKFNLLARQSLPSDQAYKEEAQKHFNAVQAQRGTISGVGSNTLAVRSWASMDAGIVGSLEQGNQVYFVNVFPDTAFYLAAPASDDPGIFNYAYGFGFMAKDYIH